MDKAMKQGFESAHDGSETVEIEFEIIDLMKAAEDIDLQELADCEGEYRVDKYYDQHPEPEELQGFDERAKAFEGPHFRLTEQGWEFMDDGSEEAQAINAFLTEDRAKRYAHEEFILSQHPTAISWDTYSAIENFMERKAKKDALQDYIDEFPDGPPYDIGFELEFEEEHDPARSIKTLLSDARLLTRFQEELPKAFDELQSTVFKLGHEKLAAIIAADVAANCE